MEQKKKLKLNKETVMKLTLHTGVRAGDDYETCPTNVPNTSRTDRCKVSVHTRKDTDIRL